MFDQCYFNTDNKTYGDSSATDYHDLEFDFEEWINVRFPLILQL
jgi:hypothetical protein